MGQFDNLFRLYCGLTSGDGSVFARYLAVAMLPTVAALSAASTQNAWAQNARAQNAWAQEVSPRLAACHEDATKRYIADFRQVGSARVSLDHPMVVTGFENGNPRYQDYFAECMNRKDTENVR